MSFITFIYYSLFLVPSCNYPIIINIALCMLCRLEVPNNNFHIVSERLWSHSISSSVPQPEGRCHPTTPLPQLSPSRLNWSPCQAVSMSFSLCGSSPCAVVALRATESCRQPRMGLVCYHKPSEVAASCRFSRGALLRLLAACLLLLVSLGGRLVYRGNLPPVLALLFYVNRMCDLFVACCCCLWSKSKRFHPASIAMVHGCCASTSLLPSFLSFVYWCNMTSYDDYHCQVTSIILDVKNYQHWVSLMEIYVKSHGKYTHLTAPLFHKLLLLIPKTWKPMMTG